MSLQQAARKRNAALPLVHHLSAQPRERPRQARSKPARRHPAFGQAVIRAYMRLFRRIYMHVKDGARPRTGGLRGVRLADDHWIAKKYASTSGWGFQFFEGRDPKKPQVTDAAKQCFACHQPKKDQDYVYSTYIREAGISAATKPQTPQSANSTRSSRRAPAKRREPHKPIHSFTPAFRSALPDATMSKTDAGPRSCCSTAAAR